MFGVDGFDSPLSAKKAGGIEAGGLEAMVQELARMVQELSKAAELLGGEGGASGQALPGLQAPAKGVEGASGVGAPGAAKGGNTMTFTNDGTSPMTVNFTPNAGDKSIDSVTLKPGEARTVEFPQGWSGNFRSTAGDGAAATLGEVKFNGGDNQTYYDVSYIEGTNASMTIEPEGGGRKSGTMENLLASAPDSVKAKTADGSVYGIKKTTTSNVQDQGVVDFYRKHVGADQGYVIPTDDASTLGTKDSHLVVRMKDLTQGTTGRV
ncbi:thaumatin family protein [Archangium gephyra]|nr:thaumatin family protein [Archangium gephyra]